MCFEVHRAFFLKKRSMLRLIRGGALRRERVGNFLSPLMTFLHICYRHIDHILTFHTSGGTLDLQPFITTYFVTIVYFTHKVRLRKNFDNNYEKFRISLQINSR